ncbi:MAG: peptidoglycan-binding domain-containing protein [Candidatus Omnitrophota bacterium]|nr:peptidoglycan-binding domain-containing protein [Candidatus Omnitrophota bacterium]
MNKSIAYTIFSSLGFLVLITGCSSRNVQKEVNMLHAQVGVITDELVRMEQSLQSLRSAIQEAENQRNDARPQFSGSKASSAGASVTSGVYRTPSGFELPSADIQRALKNAGYYQGTLDGKVGPNTRAALKTFQSDNGLDADGVCGRNTWDKLRPYLAAFK